MLDSIALAHQVPTDWRAQAEIFNELFFVFLVIGTIVGVIVVAYTLYHAYKSRDTGESPEGFEPPTLGELPVGQAGGKSNKLFLSFGISAIIVISLVVYSYGLLLYVEEGPSTDVQGEEELEVEVVGLQFGWEFTYQDEQLAEDQQVGSFNTLRVPQGELVKLSITSRDVWHAFGVPELRVKDDAIPGQYANTWFIADEKGTYEAHCYELCGTGHSYMDAEVIVMNSTEYNQWYDEQVAANQGGGGENSEENTNGTDEGTNQRVAASGYPGSSASVAGVTA